MNQASMLPLRFAQLVVPLLAALVGVLAGVNPIFGLAAALGVMYVTLVLADLAAGVVLFLGVSFLESLDAFAGVSLSKVSGGVLFLSWIAVRANERTRAREFTRDHPEVVALLLLFAAWTALSALWADSSGNALNGAMRWALNLVLFPITYSALRQPKHFRWLFIVFVLGALLTAAAGIATGAGTAVEDQTRLASDTGLNSNALGEVLIVSTVLACGLGASRALSPAGRVLALSGAGLSVLFLLLTVSRGALVGLIAALLVAPFFVGRGRRGPVMLLVAATVGAGAFYILAVAPAADRDRITHPDTTGSGRTDIWKVGITMVKARPALGVGTDNFANTTVKYLFDSGEITRSDYIIDEPKPAHNVYLQVIAELGVPGLVMFLSIILFGLRAAWRAANRFRELGDTVMDYMSRALLIGLSGLLTALFFSTNIYSKQLWLLMGAAVAAEALSRERQAGLTGG